MAGETGRFAVWLIRPHYEVTSSSLEIPIGTDQVGTQVSTQVPSFYKDHSRGTWELLVLVTEGYRPNQQWSLSFPSDSVTPLMVETRSWSGMLFGYEVEYHDCATKFSMGLVHGCGEVGIRLERDGGPVVVSFLFFLSSLLSSFLFPLSSFSFPLSSFHSSFFYLLPSLVPPPEPPRYDGIRGWEETKCHNFKCQMPNAKSQLLTPSRTRYPSTTVKVPG